MTGDSSVFSPYSSTPPCSNPSINSVLYGWAAKSFLASAALDFLPDKWKLAGGDLAHALLDRRQILRRERLQRAIRVTTQVEVVVEAVLDGRPDGNVRFREALDHCLSHDMRRRMAQPVEWLRCPALDYVCRPWWPPYRISVCTVVIADDRRLSKKQKLPAHWGEELAIPPKLARHLTTTCHL